MIDFNCITCGKHYQLTQEEIADGESINFCCEACADQYAYDYENTY